MAGETARQAARSGRWEAQVAALSPQESRRRSAREPLSAGRIVDTALQLVQREGFDALTMRRLAAVLEATPGALYPHVRDKQNLDDLVLGAICARVRLPRPDPATWQAQAIGICEQLRDEYLRYPGIWRATLAAAPSTPDTMRIMEGLLAVLTGGGVPLRYAAWAIDAALQYTGAYSVTAPRRSREGSGPAAVLTRDEVTARLAMLPPDRFPITAAHAAELTSGDGHERFAFTLGLLFGGLPRRQPTHDEHDEHDEHDADAGETTREATSTTSAGTGAVTGPGPARARRPRPRGLTPGAPTASRPPTRRANETDQEGTHP